ncbi:MAG TPA: hypothetical protein VMG09_16800 [Bacteroidota bacterium]|nr:hypothetical protein [Bacteroidota bacterium]
MNVLLLRIGGAYCLAFALFHLCFWRIFRWNADLSRLSEVNRGIMQVLNLCLTFLFGVFGLLFMLFPGELVATSPGRFILASTSLFWLARAVEQWIFFKPRTMISFAFIVIFLCGSGLFFLPLIGE